MSSGFAPAWFLRNPHAQTVWGRLARPRQLVALRREVLVTSDDDDLILLMSKEETPITVPNKGRAALMIFAATLVAGFRPLSVLAVPLAFLLIALIAIVFAALATAIGSSLKEMQGFQMVMNFFVMPLWFLSGALYPLTGLPAALTVLTRIDPLTYGVDGVRGLMLGTSHFGVALDVGVLLAVGALFVAAGAWRFSKIEV